MNYAIGIPHEQGRGARPSRRGQGGGRCPHCGHHPGADRDGGLERHEDPAPNPVARPWAVRLAAAFGLVAVKGLFFDTAFDEQMERIETERDLEVLRRLRGTA